ncbi:enolase-like domain-containing protein [Fodinicola feengrottensis]|uniref:hypothetical protein n=1 Tax=Fodinicola feengrottensis TaxID=435914 RepID=UPI002442152D|nr:hypothetical protein [Fodinicola feengrottensis]
MPRISALTVSDVRFPTSRELDGSDAMNPDPDYSAAYLTLHTEADPVAYSLVFTIGRGNDVVAAAVESLSPYIVGRDVDELCDDLGGFFPALWFTTRLATSLAGPGKGRHAHGDRVPGQRRLGPRLPASRQTAMEVFGRSQPPRAGRAGRFPLSDRRVDPG